MAYACKILADSISPANHRLTSWEVTFPRIVLAEMNTHCMLSRNSASSRAIPVPKRIAAVLEDPFVPEVFGRNQKGMQPGEALDGEDDELARHVWNRAKRSMIDDATMLANAGVHKQYANRLLEPFSWHTAVVTATDLDNFFHLRVNPLAQGELREAVTRMQCVRTNSEPRMLNYGDWHLPYVEPSEAFDFAVSGSGIDPVKVSVARCARVSYLTQNGVRDPREDVALYDRLIESAHMSPLEHVARPMTDTELNLTRAYDVSFNNGPALRTGGEGTGTLNGVTSVRGPLYYSGKLNGWISRRAHIPNEWDILGART